MELFFYYAIASTIRDENFYIIKTDSHFEMSKEPIIHVDAKKFLELLPKLFNPFNEIYEHSKVREITVFQVNTVTKQVTEVKTVKVD